MNFLYFIKRHFLLLLIIVLASLTYFTNLGGQGYSLDEPLTMVVARTVFTYGYPSAWDGKILISAAGDDYTQIGSRYFYTWQPWVQYYIVAPFYLIFGNSVGMLRIPFVLFGIATVFMFYQVSQILFKKSWVSFLLSVQLLFLMPFFLYVRQIRYYSPSVFFSILLFWLLLKFIDNKLGKKLLFLFFLASFLLFWTNYLIWLTDLPLFFLFAIWKRNKAIIAILIFEAIVGFLWFHFFAPFGGSPLKAYAMSRPSFLIAVKQYLSYINNFIFPFIMLPLVVLGAIKLKKSPFLLLVAVWMGGKIVVYSIIYAPHGRQLVDIMPLCVLLTGFIYSYLWEKKQTFSVFLFGVLLITTNIFSVIPAYVFPFHQRQFHFYPAEFASEFIGYYPTAFLQVSKYIAKKAKPTDLFWSNDYVWTTYLYSNVPTFTVLCDPKTKTFIGPKSVTNPKDIRWFIFFGGKQPEQINTVSCFGHKWQQYMAKNYKSYYKRIVLPLPTDTYVVNDPDIVSRQFPPTRVATGDVVIYERR